MKRIVVTIVAQDDAVEEIRQKIQCDFSDRPEVQEVNSKVQELPFFPPARKRPVESFAEAIPLKAKIRWYQQDGFSKSVSARLAPRYTPERLLSEDPKRIAAARGFGPIVATAVAQWKEWRLSEPN